MDLHLLDLTLTYDNAFVAVTIALIVGHLQSDRTIYYILLNERTDMAAQNHIIVNLWLSTFLTLARNSTRPAKQTPRR